MNSADVLLWSSTTGNPYQQVRFIQSGGNHVVSNLLAVTTAISPFVTNGYTLQGGRLTVRNLGIDSGGTFYHIGGTLTQTALLILGNGTWIEQTSGQQFGQLALTAPAGSSATLSLPQERPCQLRFAPSSGVVWSNQALLLIEHWQGAVYGGGIHQVIFGSDRSALTPQQVAQIQFHNPAGAMGNFPARILPSGEIVPARLLLARRSATDRVLEWASGTLQSATSVNGPFQDLQVSSPYTITFAELQRFFRLKQ